MKKFIKGFLLIALLTIITTLSIFFYDINKIRSISGIVINEDTNYIELLTENDSIYKFEYNNNYSVGDAIKIKYKNKLNNLKSIQPVIIKEVTFTTINLNYSNEAIEIVKNFTLEEKVAQLLLARAPIIYKVETVEKYNLCGYVLFQIDIGNKTKEVLIDEIQTIKDASSTPMFFAIDEEGGAVSRLSSNTNIVTTPFLSPQELYKIGKFKKIKEDAINKINLLEELGFNLNLAPVADIVTDPNSYMYERSLGQNKSQTSKYIKTILSTQKDDVYYVLKHFPGYGNNLDTHKGIATDNRQYSEIKNNDLVPFEAGIKSGVKAILVSHNISSSIDNKPASLSRNMHNILRSELNFDGIIITDDLSMGAIKEYNTDHPYIDAVLAGNNVLIVTDFTSAYNEILGAVNDGTIKEVLLDRLVLKTIQLKIDMNLYK